MFDKIEKRLLITAFIVLIIALFFNLSIVPLYLEEPRRALIALEMLFNHNLIVPREMGEFYYKKPPLFNWLIIASYKIFGEGSELAQRLISVLSLLAMAMLTFLFVRKYATT